MSPSGLVDDEVTIAGAGPTGLMAACLLSRLGIGVRIIDKSPSAAKESRAFGLQARSLEFLLSIGIVERFLDRGVITAGARIFIEGRQVAQFDFSDVERPDTPYPFLLMVPQNEIEAILAEDLSEHGVTVERGCELVGFDQDPDHVTVRTRGSGQGADATETTRRTGYLIGADGAHSVVRHGLGLSFEGAPYPQSFLLADCRVDWPLDQNRVTIFLRGREMALFLPLRGKERARIMATDAAGPPAPSGIEQQGSSPVTLEEVEETLRRASGIDVRLRDAVWMSRYRVHHRGVDRYRVGRCFVAGDAAHIHSPAGGQGMNTGLQDAANLAWKLGLVLRGRAESDLLDSYHAERWPVGQKVLQVTDRIFSGVTTQSDWGVALRDLIMPLAASVVTRTAYGRSKAFHFMSELGIRYEPDTAADHAALDGAKPWRGGPEPGRRAPNAVLTRTRDLFGELAAYRFHVLALSHEALDGEEIGRLAQELDDLRRRWGADLGVTIVARSLVGRDQRIVQPERGDVFAAYAMGREVPRALYLLRPDAYVAWRAPRFAVAELESVLTSRFARSA